MNKNLLAITGEPGAGKDTVCDCLQKELPDPARLRFSDPLFDTLSMFCDEVTRNDQQWLVKKLRERFGENVLGRAIKKKIKKSKADWIILNGLRKWGEFEMIKNLGGKLIYVTARPKLRWQRLQNRKEKGDDQDSFENFLKKEENSPERDISEIGQSADFQIKNNDSKEKLKQKTKEILKKIQKEANR